MSSKSMRRAKRSAEAISRGPEIFAFVNGKVSRRKLLVAAETGVPPISALSDDLHKRFSPEITNPAVKQFVGLCVRAVLEEHGFDVYQPGVRLHKDRVFSTGSTYRKKAQKPESPGNDDA